MRSRLDARLARLEHLSPDRQWLYGEGLASLLEAARGNPLQPWDVDDDEPPSALGLLFQEARRFYAQKTSSEEYQYGTN